MYSDRVMELQKSLKAFGKSDYNVSEIQPELLKLQKEMVEIAFNNKNAATAGFGLYDVERHLQKLNEERGHIADKELENFMNDCKAVCNLMHAESSGSKEDKEDKALKKLKRLKGNCVILRNVGLSDGRIRTELDAVVISSAGITIVEVNNAEKDIRIGAKGDCYSAGVFLGRGCNMAEKISVNEKLLANAVGSVGGEEVRIQSVVVFSDSHIGVYNECNQVKSCFANTLDQVIDSFGSGRYSNDAVHQMAAAVVDAMNDDEFCLVDFDAMKLKNDFATVMAILEGASAK